MSVDPLSPATRAVKRNLLVVSVLAVTYRAFDVSIDKIPIVGLSISFDSRVFVFLLSLCLAYFFCIFVIYYFIDIKNIEPSSHEIGSEQRLNDRIGTFAGASENIYMDKLADLHPGKVFQGNNYIATILKRIENGAVHDGKNSPRSTLDSLKISVRVPQPYSMDSLQQMDFQSHRSLYLQAARQLREMMRGYRRKFLVVKSEQYFRASTVRLTYRIRNYGTDGVLPVALGILAALALYDLLPLEWLRHISPPK